MIMLLSGQMAWAQCPWAFSWGAHLIDGTLVAHDTDQEGVVLSTPDLCGYTGYTGKVVPWTINWPGGDFEASLTSLSADLDIFLVNDCAASSISCLGESRAGNNDDENISISGLTAGTYYIVIAGWNGVDGTADLSIISPASNDFCTDNSFTSPLICGESVTITLDLVQGASSTVEGNNIDEHCGQTGYDGADWVFPIDWEGGDLQVRLDEKQAGQELFLYSDCDPTACMAQGESEILSPGLAAGTYYVVVDGKNGAAGKITLSIDNLAQPCLLPDFKAIDISTNSACVNPGDQITVTVTLGSDGRRPFTAAELAIAEDVFELQDGSNFIELKSIPSRQVLPGQSIVFTETVTIPSNLTSGDYDFNYYADFPFRNPSNEVAEAFRGGNLASFPISIGTNTGPDYLPSNLTGPTSANPGQAITMTLSIQNTGNTNGAGSSGNFYLSLDDQFDNNDIFLSTAVSVGINAGQSINVNGTNTIPTNQAPRDYYILFRSDANDEVAECNEANNVVSHLINIRAGNPDYVPTNFTLDGKVSLSAARGQRLSCFVIAKNIGNSAGTLYTDGRYYYSPDANFDPNVDLYLGEDNVIGPLAPGGTQHKPESILVPATAVLGQGYIFYWLDGDEKIVESDETNNAIYIPIFVTAEPTALNASFTASNTSPCKETDITFSSTVTGGNTILDQSRHGRDGTLNNGNNPQTNGPSNLGNAIDLSGSDDFISVGDLGPVYSWTIETWFKPNGLNDSENLFHSQNVANNIGIRVEMRASNASSFGDLYVVLSGDGSTITHAIVPRGANLSNDWHHLAIVGDQAANTLTVYLDGNKVNDYTHSNWPAKFPDLAIGTAYGSGQTRNFTGSMDEFRIWNGVRTEAEILARKDNGLVGNEAGLLLYYNFNQSLAGGNISYNWSFPGGTPSSSTDPNPTVSYANAGNYNVSLTLNNGSSSDTDTKNNFIDVKSCDGSGGTGNDELDAAYTFTPTFPCPGDPVQFTDATTGLDGSGATYAYTFENGTPATSSAVNPLVSWATPGTYSVVLTVTQNGISNATYGSVTVTSCAPSEPNWPVIATGANHTVIIENDVVVDLDGSSLAVGDYIGAFYTDNGLEKCGGKIRWTGQNVSVSVFGDDAGGIKDGFANGETFKWRVWQANTQTEFNVSPAYEPIGGIITHQGNYANNGISELTNLSFKGEQSLSLQPGWNMISSYVQADAPAMESIFNDIQSSIVLVKDEIGTAYLPSVPVNQIGDWLVEEGYQVKVNSSSALELVILGTQVEPENTPLNLKENWNIMAYLRDGPQNVEDALTRIKDQIILVKNGAAQTYIPDFNINTIGDMLPGQGYQIKLSANRTFSYDPNSNRKAGLISPVSGKNPVTQTFEDGPDWPVTNTGDNHTIILEDTIMSDFGGEELQVGDYIGVFFESGDSLVCGGKIAWTGENIALSAFGDDTGSPEKDGFAADEAFIWKVWRASDSTEFMAMAEYKATDVVISHVGAYATNGISGLSSLVEMDNTGISSFLELGIKMYPNPSEGQFWIELPADMTAASVEVFSYTGQAVYKAELQGHSKQMIDLKDYSDGIYVIKLHSGSKTAVSRILMKR